MPRRSSEPIVRVEPSAAYAPVAVRLVFTPPGIYPLDPHREIHRQCKFYSKIRRQQSVVQQIVFHRDVKAVVVAIHALSRVWLCRSCKRRHGKQQQRNQTDYGDEVIDQRIFTLVFGQETGYNVTNVNIVTARIVLVDSGCGRVQSNTPCSDADGIFHLRDSRIENGCACPNKAPRQ